MSKIRVLLVDDQELFVKSLKRVIEADTEDIEVVGIAVNGADAVSAVGTLKPDLVLMDVRMPVMDGVEAAKSIRKLEPETLVLMLTTFEDDEYVLKAVEYGACGYLLKDIDPSRLIIAIRAVVGGACIFDQKVLPKIVKGGSGDGQAVRKKQDHLLERLTFREREILALIEEGRSNEEIGNILHLGIQTVRNYTSLIYSKTGIHNRLRIVSGSGDRVPPRGEG
jgi:DNA-binding NarL/FixJ family response regulator